MSNKTTEGKTEIDEEEKSASDFLTTNIISYDSTVTCGKCKKQMTYQEYDSKHRSFHYHLCWIDGIEEEIDFSDTSKVQSILRQSINKCTTKLKLKCEWCDEIRLTLSGYANHLKKCKNNSVSHIFSEESLIECNNLDSSSTTTTHNDESLVSCGRCRENMSYAEYKNEHRVKHYNLCWLDGEEKIDYLNENNVVVLLREILPKLTEKSKHVIFVCEWCEEHRKSLVGYASHVKKCAVEQNIISLPQSEETNSIQPIDEKYKPDSMISCGRCNKSLLYKEYEELHKSTHYNLCWINGDEKPNFDDENITQCLLRQSLPRYAARQKKVNFICEWCEVTKKSVPGFASHIKQCQLRPDKQGLLNVTENENGAVLKSDIEITKDRDASMVTCGRCNNVMTYKQYRSNHRAVHYNLCWIDGEEVKLDLEDYDSVLSKLKQFIPFSAIRKRSVKLTCEECKSVKKSVAGFASHVIFCNKTASDIKLLLSRCDECGNKVKPSSLFTHKLKNCKGTSKMESGDDSIYDRSDYTENGFYKVRRRRRPPNVLSFHPDTKYVSEYFDCMCRLCDFVTLSVNDLMNHFSNTHNIDLNNTTNNLKLEEYMLNKYDPQKNIYLKPLFNYYNFFKKTFWKTNCHEDFKPDVQILNNNEALKYLPSIHQSCKLFNSDNEQICVDLFKSTYVNGMLWLFTGGPNWAMSWCPVPEEVQTQYLAISCHPKPDLMHKEMEIYKYPSLVQLWTFNSLSNINYEPTSAIPYMSYGLAHEFGAVWDMAWCPSGAYEPKNKIGLLALSTSCGDCPVFAMPHVDGNSKMFYIYKARPVIARNFECEWIESGVQCTKVCWQVLTPFKTLICGYSNGMVSIFNINFKSIFMNDDILYPSHTFRASRCSITGLSINYFNSSILATSTTDGIVSLWDLKSTENPIFLKKAYSPSDCTWLQQCYTLVYCSKGVNSAFIKVRTVNFSNCDDDFDDYNPELYVLKTAANKSKVINNYNVVNRKEKLNCDDSDVSINGNKSNGDDESITVSNMNSDDESYKCEESSSNSDEEKSNNALKSGDTSRNIDDEDYYGPTFYQRSTHWSISTSDWMNLIATGDENGGIYEKLFLPETNHLRKGNSTTLQLSVKKLISSDEPQSSYSNGYRFKDTVEHFGIESKFYLFDENLPNQNDNKPLLRYPLDNITKVSWNQNFSSFRWLAIGTQSGFTLISPSQAISDSYIQSFYKSTTSSNVNKC